MDTVVQAFKISEQLMLPAMLILDAFFLSHTYEPVDMPDQKIVDEYLPPYKPEYFLDTKKEQSYGGLATPETYYELRYMIQMEMARAPELIRDADNEFRDRFGRGYGLIDPYRADDAEILFVTAGTMASTTREAVDRLRDRGKSVGMIRIRTFRPFPAADIKKAFRHAKKVAVVDRNISFGASGIFYQEIKAALFHDPKLGQLPVFGFIAGLGGRDVTPEVLEEIYSYTENNNRPHDEIIWIGVKR
jgi:pyruvate/2-oxoacid:ferredoxin oxidoreductase alpha subunit